MTGGPHVGTLELGGTHVTGARVDPGGPRVVPGTRHRRDWRPDAAREELLATLAGAARDAAAPGVERWGVATPGPFDYARGICRIHGVAKLEALDGTDLRAFLADVVGLADARRVRFCNDADAFVLGEWAAGAARDHDRAVGITLGSGLGSGFAVGGSIVTGGPGVPPEGRLDLLSLRGAPVEATISRRGLLAAWHAAGGTRGLEVVDIAARARDGDPVAVATFGGLGEALVEFLAPRLRAFAPTCLVVGGSIARAWDLLAPALGRLVEEVEPLATVTPATLGEDAPLIGAATHATAAA